MPKAVHKAKQRGKLRGLPKLLFIQRLNGIIFSCFSFVQDPWLMHMPEAKASHTGRWSEGQSLQPVEKGWYPSSEACISLLLVY